MGINQKINVPVFGTVGKKVLINPNATDGATFGKNLFYGDGTTVVTLANLATALGLNNPNQQPTVLWNQLAAIRISLLLLR